MLILDTSAEEIVPEHMQQCILSLALHTLGDDSAAAYVARYQRHKSEEKNGEVYYTGCWRDRHAFVCADANDETDIKMYAYLAAGRDLQPPNTYVLLFKSVPPQLAERLYAWAFF